jgi:hypothetical protein
MHPHAGHFRGQQTGAVKRDISRLLVDARAVVPQPTLFIPALPLTLCWVALDTTRSGGQDAGPNWDNLMRVASAATRDAIVTWHRNTWVPKRDGTVNASKCWFAGGMFWETRSIGQCFDPLKGALITAGASSLLAEGFCTAVANAWSKWAGDYQLHWPGLPLFPDFLSWPGPEAPPTLSTGMPIGAGMSSCEVLLWPFNLAESIRREMRNRQVTVDDAASRSIDDFAQRFFRAFLAWKAVGLLFWGGGPTIWAPPYVPTAPVVGGWITTDPPSFQGNLPSFSNTPRFSPVMGDFPNF